MSSFGGTLASTAATRALLADPLEVDYMVLLDDFVGGSNAVASYGTIGSLNWANPNITSAQTSAYITGVANHPGIYRIETGALDNDGGALAFNYSTGSFTENGRLPPVNALTGWRMRWVWRINSTASISFRMGMTVDANAVQPADGIWWQYDTDASDTNFSAVCRASSTETKTASGTAADTNWHVFDIFCDTSGTISFSLDGGTAITIATNVPTIALSPWVNVVTRTTAAKSGDVDYFGMFMTVAR